MACIVVEDGIARLIAAIAVAATHTLRQIEATADETVCTYTSDEFAAVEKFFEHFSSVSGDEVLAGLWGKRGVTLILRGAVELEDVKRTHPRPSAFRAERLRHRNCTLAKRKPVVRRSR